MMPANNLSPCLHTNGKTAFLLGMGDIRRFDCIALPLMCTYTNICAKRNLTISIRSLYLFFFFLSFGAAAQSRGLWPPHSRGFLDHTQPTQHSRQVSSGRVISSSQRPLRDHTQHLQQIDIHAPGGIRTHNLSRRAAADLRIRPRSHWDRPLYLSTIRIVSISLFKKRLNKCRVKIKTFYIWKTQTISKRKKGNEGVR